MNGKEQSRKRVHIPTLASHLLWNLQNIFEIIKNVSEQLLIRRMLAFFSNCIFAAFSCFWMLVLCAFSFGPYFRMVRSWYQMQHNYSCAHLNPLLKCIANDKSKHIQQKQQQNNNKSKLFSCCNIIIVARK